MLAPLQELSFFQILNLKRDYNLHRQVWFQAIVFFSGDIIYTSYIYSVTLPELPQRMIVWKLCWRQWEHLRPDGKCQKDALEQPRPGTWRTILHHWITASTRIWERHKIELAGVVLTPRPSSSKTFVNDDDDDIYDSEHRLK